MNILWIKNKIQEQITKKKRDKMMWQEKEKNIQSLGIHHRFFLTWSVSLKRS